MSSDDNQMRESIHDAIAAALGDAYDCTRVWSAWSYGTMGEDDFSLITDDSDRMAELTDAVLAAIAAPVAAAPVDLHAHLLHMLGAKDHGDAGRIIGEFHAASMSTPAAPGIDLRLREMLDGWKNSDYPLSYEGQCAQKALNACIADVEGLLIDASPKGGSDERARFEAWAQSRNHDMHRSNGGPTFEVGEYTGELTAEAWLAWQAAMQATSDSPKGGSADAPKYTTGHCENHKKPGGCPMHNLQCGYPQCDRRQATSAEVGA